MMTTAFLVAVGLTLVYAYFSGSARRGFTWLFSQLLPDPNAPKARLADVVSYGGLILTVMGFTIGYVTLSAENSEANLQNQKKDLIESIAALDQRLRDERSKERPDFAPGVDIHLESPLPETAIIRTGGPELRWQYAKHTDRVNYVVEIIKLGPGRDNPQQLQETCDFTNDRNCRFYATEPTAQRSQIPSADEKHFQGSFLWRVTPAKARVSNSIADFSPISDWSEYGSFSTYPDLSTRLKNRKFFLVGTTYSGNVHFSSIAGHGARGYDLDLIWILLERCIKVGAGGASVDAEACEAQVRNIAQFPKDLSDWQQAEIRTYPSVEDGLNAVQKRELDVFVGSVTRTEAREENGLRFTKGYYPFKTSLYGRRSRHSGSGIEEWAREPKTIGVIQKSTNEWLARELTLEAGFADLSVVGLPDYASMKGAFESRKIEGVLIDDVLGQDLIRGDPCEVEKITGLEGTGAWSRYHKRLQSDSESFAIATATDPVHGRIDLPSRFVDWLSQCFGIQRPSAPDDLYSALTTALSVLQMPDGKLRGELDDALHKRNFPAERQATSTCNFSEPASKN